MGGIEKRKKEKRREDTMRGATVSLKESGTLQGYRESTRNSAP